ncbi:MAG: PepSY domain-containing protein [Eubacterium sp.]|nr:PepSY domain-containing protein [Eubacterium sp.]
MKYTGYIINTIITAIVTILVIIVLRYSYLLFSSEKDNRAVLVPDPSPLHSQSLSSGKELGEDEITEIVLSRIPGASREDIIKLDYDSQDGYFYYDGIAVVNKIIYKFEIDAGTGTILDWEVDY